MALSEHEQRLLDEMERNLYQSEADVVDTSNAPALRPNYRAIVVGVVILAAGVGGLLLGVVSQFAFVGVLGFAAMLFGVLYIFSPKNQASQGAAGSTKRSNQSHVTKPSFSERMQQRWIDRGYGPQ